MRTVNKLLCLMLILTSQLMGQVDVEFKTIQLSYIPADRAAGVLKSIGYNLIDFTTTSGPNPNELIFEPAGPSATLFYKGEVENRDDLPVIIVMPETENITLLEMQGAVASKESEMGVDLGGSSLVYTTSGEPLQRLMIAYDPQDPESLSKLLSIISNEIDVAAKQVIIEALIIEIDANEINSLGINYTASGSMYSTSFPEPNPETGTFTPFTFVLDKTLLGNALDADAKLQSLVSSQSANVLSRPSVLVIDGRQARIVVGQQIPIARSTATGQNVVSATEYIPIGIVLNLRPRISSDGNDITIQVETIISEAVERVGVGSVGGDVLSAPVFNSRKVQTYVQVANNTPFIIGGLISKKDSDQQSEIPILGSLPLIGKLFSYTKETDTQKEVIVVITPHIVDVAERAFTQVIPKDSDLFQSLGNMLFQNSYRLQLSDVFDLGFVTNTSVYKNTFQDINNLLEDDPTAKSSDVFTDMAEGAIPGQEILIRRMLYNVIERVGYYKHVDPNKIFFFAEDPGEPGAVRTNSFSEEYSQFLKKRDRTKSLQIFYEANITDLSYQDYPLRPVGRVEAIAKGSIPYKQRLRELNANKDEGYAVMLHDPSHERRLYEVLILRRVLEMNPGILDNISHFKPGLQILFPSPETLEQDTHILDNEIAQYFYEVNDYNNTFDEAFIEGVKSIRAEIDSY